MDEAVRTLRSIGGGASPGEVPSCQAVDSTAVFRRLTLSLGQSGCGHARRSTGRPAALTLPG